MRAADTLSAALFLALGAGVIFAGWDLRVGRPSDPGSGFMIFWVGVVMSGLSFVALTTALRSPVGAGLRALWTGARVRHVPFITVLLAAYAYLLPLLGFPLVTAVLLLILFRSVEPQRWLVAIAGSLLATAASYLLFARVLGTQLPLGTLWAG